MPIQASHAERARQAFIERQEVNWVNWHNRQIYSHYRHVMRRTGPPAYYSMPSYDVAFDVLEDMMQRSLRDAPLNPRTVRALHLWREEAAHTFNDPNFSEFDRMLAELTPGAVRREVERKAASLPRVLSYYEAWVLVMKEKGSEPESVVGASHGKIYKSEANARHALENMATKNLWECKRMIMMEAHEFADVMESKGNVHLMKPNHPWHDVMVGGVSGRMSAMDVSAPPSGHH